MIANETITEEWEQYSSDQYLTLKSYSIGSYLLGTNWGQGSPYNQSCPLDPNTGQRCLVGCTAAAMGQILNYWQCKVFPDGTTTYYPNNYFTNPLTVNFFNQIYDWGNMNTVPSVTAELLYHCGVAIQVNYTDSSTGGYSSYVEYALENKFGFQTSGLKSKDSYSPSTWIAMLKADIDAGRPIYYDGTNNTVSPTTAHAWVIDGYDTNNAFHCNWGWNGNYQSTFFPLTDLTPDSHNYNTDQHAILGIAPILDACSELSGSEFICSSNESYMVSIPSTASVLWSITGNLTPVNNNNEPTYTVHATSSTGGIGSITATIKNSQGQTFLTRTRNFWAGTPPTPEISSYSTYVWTTDYGYPAAKNYTVYTEQDIVLYDENINTYGGLIENFDWTWYIDDEGKSYDSYDYGAGGKMYIFHEPGTFRIRTSSENCSSTDLSAPVYVDVIEEEYRMSISPNPSTSEATIELKKSKGDIINESIEWNLEVYDALQRLKTKTSNLKGSRQTINTLTWEDGVYIVSVKIDKKLISGKLVVKH